MSNSKHVSHWIDLVKHGDSVAANQIWQHYFDRLVRSVRHKLHGQNRVVSDEEDIVLSVFDSFYIAVEKGRFPDLSDRYDLWRLLLRMSARKSYHIAFPLRDGSEKKFNWASELSTGIS